MLTALFAVSGNACWLCDTEAVQKPQSRSEVGGTAVQVSLHLGENCTHGFVVLVRDAEGDVVSNSRGEALSVAPPRTNTPRGDRRDAL